MKKITLYKLILSAIIAVVSAQLFLSCKGTTGNKNKEQVILTAVAPSKPPSSYNDTLTINFISAVFYNPDPLQREKIRSVNKEEVFESLEHEYLFQMKNARMVLKKYWPRIRIIESSKARWLAFEKAGGSRTYIDLNSKNDMSGIILFDTKKDPLLIDMMNIDTAIEFYFNN